jgi:hypothetical protein
MNGMKRWVWITASLAALFGLQGALCALACLEGPAVALASHPAGAQMPCHGGPSQPSPEPVQQESEPSCGCGASLVALSEAGEAIGGGLLAASLPARVVLVRMTAPVATNLHAPAPERLPPPDTLLLKSTLIV